MQNSISQKISQVIAELRSEGVTGLEQYEQRLISNAKDIANLKDLLVEGRAALMFLHNGFMVTIRECPDLQLSLDGEIVYAEVKHFREKEQDQIDEEAMLETANLLVPIGNITLLEGDPAWKQIANVAIKKAKQYVDGAPNILVIESSSESLVMMLETAVHEYDEVLRTDDQRLRRLNAFMLINTRSDGFGASGPRNVEFCPTAHAVVPMSTKFVSALRNIRLG